MLKHESHSEKEKPPVTAEEPREPSAAQFTLASPKNSKVVSVYLLFKEQ